MKSLVCTKPFSFEYKLINAPEYAKGNTLLRIKRIGICGTDIHAFEGTQPFFNYPRILGHEIAAEIVKTDAPDFSENENVTFIPYFNCGQCVACRNNKPNCCVSLKVCGVHIDGGMVEYLSVPSSSLLHGENLNCDELALVEPLAIGAHAISRANVRENEFALIIGAGPIGLAIIEFAKIAFANVIVMDVNQNRLIFCEQQLNVKHIINANGSNINEILLDITNGDMPDVVFDATGNLKAVNNAFQYISHGGRFVLVGLQKEMIHFSHPEFHKREATLMSSRNATTGDFEHVINCLTKKMINPTNFITHKIKFDEAKDKFADLLNPATKTIKAMIEMN